MDEPSRLHLRVLNSVLGAGYKNEPCLLQAGQRDKSSKRRSWESPSETQKNTQWSSNRRVFREGQEKFVLYSAPESRKQK